MFPRYLTLALSALLLVLSACTEAPPPEQASAEPGESASSASSMSLGVSGITEASYRRHVATLSSDEFGGRGPGTPGEELTVNYLVTAFKDLGLAPGNGDSYMQDVPLVSVEVTNQPDLTISDGAGNVMTLGFKTEQVLATRRQVGGAQLQYSEVVFVGYGINAPERDWNDYAGIDVTGKTVVILVNDPGYATQDPNLFNGNAMTYYGRWDYKYDEAALQGAAGAIIIHDTKPAAYPWATVQNSWTGPDFDVVRPDQGMSLAEVESWITQEKAVELFAMAGMDLRDMYEQAQTPGFTAKPMGLSASAELEIEIHDVTSRNVAALLPGSEAPDEVFIYMAHWDHLGTDPALEGDGIFNGAYDNATGTAGLLQLAAAFSSLPEKPRRSILFLAVTAEEQGLLGSLHYASNPIFPLAETVAGLNMDGLSYWGETRDVVVAGFGFSELDEILKVEADKRRRVLVPDPAPEKGYYFRSDHFELAKLGVPMLYPKAGHDSLEHGLEWGMAKAAEFVANDYHRVSDEYSEDWDVDGALEDLALYFMTGKSIASGDSWPNWNEGTEFKATRDAQRASAAGG